MTADRTEWLKGRRQGIGGSDMAAILGLSPWKTPLDVWEDKTGRKPLEESTGLQLRIGTELEDLVARMWSEENGREVRRFNTQLSSGHRIGNIDRLVVPVGKKIASLKGEIRTNEAIECKTSSQPPWEEVPLYYITQVFTYMGIATPLEIFHVPVIFLLNKKYSSFRVERDERNIANMADFADRWWEEYVVKDTPPPPANETEVKRLFPRHVPNSVTYANADQVSLLKDLKRVRTVISESKKEEQALKDKVMSFIGGSEAVMFNGKKVATFKSNKDGSSIDWEGLAKSFNPSDKQIADFTHTYPGARVLRISIKEEK